MSAVLGYVSVRSDLRIERDPEAHGMWEASADGFGPVARGATPIEAIEALRAELRERTGPTALVTYNDAAVRDLESA